MVGKSDLPYLAELDLSRFDAKAPPPKTSAYWEIVEANRAPKESEIADVLDEFGNPPAVTLSMLLSRAYDSFADWLRDRKNRRQIPHRLEAAGYVAVRNECPKDGLWRVLGKLSAIYARRDLSVRDRLAAAEIIAAN